MTRAAARWANIASLSANANSIISELRGEASLAAKRRHHEKNLDFLKYIPYTHIITVKDLIK